MRFTVTLSPPSTEAVTVSFATKEGTATPGDDYQPAHGTLTFAPESTAAQQIEVRLSDDAVDEDEETFILRLSDPRGAALAVASATATIVDDDQRAVTFEPTALTVPEGGSSSYTVVLGSQPTGPVTVTPVTTSAELTVDPAELRFTPADWQSPRTVTVTADQDGDAVADAPAHIEHVARGGGYADAFDTPVSATIVEDDVSTLAMAAAHASEGAGTMRFAVTLSLASDDIVTVDYATEEDTATEGQDYTRTTGTLRFPARSAVAQTISVTVRDDTLDENRYEQFTVTLSNPTHAPLAGGAATLAATGRIEDDDPPPRLSISEGRLTEGSGDGAMRFAVTLDRASGRTVTVDYATTDATAHAGADYTPVSGTLTFPATTTTRTIAVPIADDALDEEDRETFTVKLSAAVHATLTSAGRTATGTIEDDDPPPRLSIAAASVTEGDGNIRFAVSLDPASGRTVTVDYTTAEGTATAGSDYTTVAGTLTFLAAATVRTISVPVLDDQDPEDTETFTVTLSASVNATVASAGRTATGTIEDHDLPPRLSIADASLTEGSSDETMNFMVSLDPAAGGTVTVDYATADGTATAGSDYTTANGTLTLHSGSTTQTIPVTILADSADEEAETFTVTLSNPTGAALSDATATGTIIDHVDTLSLELSSLQVTGAGSMYPAFAADTYHYALTCTSSTTLQVSAQALRTNAQLTLLRARHHLNVVATGTLTASITVNQDHDIAIELSDAGDTVTYVVHCLPANFPDVRILRKTAGVSEDLMLVVPKVITGLFQDKYKFATIMDNNGVPRFHVAGISGNFRAFSSGPTINGRQVQYSVTRAYGHSLYDESFRHLRTVSMSGWDPHDFLITEDDTLLFMGYKSATRDASHITDPADQTPLSTRQRVRDATIVERTLLGTTLFEWNSWDHLNIPDCISGGFTEGYAQINGFHLVNGDIVASFRNCATVLRIDRSGGTGAVEWQVGGSSANPQTAFRPITGDDAAHNEFCAQHNPTQLGDKLVVFDNGNRCVGPRKADPVFSRVVAYDLSSGTEARFSREYRRRSGHGYARYEGGVTVLGNGNWLIFWGYPLGYTVGVDELVTISEVNPRGEVVFEMNMSGDGYPVSSYRVYRMPETEFKIPWNLP